MSKLTFIGPPLLAVIILVFMVGAGVMAIAKAWNLAWKGRINVNFA